MKLTDKEIKELQLVQSLGYKYIARDGDKKSRVFAWEIRPYRCEIEWLNDTSVLKWLYSGEYNFIKWEDEPMSIDELLSNSIKPVNLDYQNR